MARTGLQLRLRLGTGVRVRVSRVRVCINVRVMASFWVMIMEYEVEGARPRGRPKKTCREIVEKDCQARGLNREDAMDRIRWMKQTRDDR